MRLLIKGAVVYTMAEQGVVHADVLVQDGKIIAVAPGIAPEQEDQILHAEGMYLLPGLMDGHVHLGLMDMESGEISETTAPVTPDMEIEYSVDFASKDFTYCMKEGITSVCIIPGSSNIIGGKGIVVKTNCAEGKKEILNSYACMKAAMGGNPQSAFGRRGKAPATRMEILRQFRAYLEAVRLFTESGEREITSAYRRSELLAGVPVLEGKVPIKIHCTRHDMAAVMQVLKDFPVKYTLDHAWGTAPYVDQIAEAGCGVMFGPAGCYRGLGEGREIDFRDVRSLYEKGVEVAMISDAPLLSPESIIYEAGEAVSAGVPVEEALKMITLYPARWTGCEERIGSIEPGKDADLVLFNGLPARDVHARVMYTIISGNIVYKMMIEEEAKKIC